MTDLLSALEATKEPARLGKRHQADEEGNASRRQGEGDTTAARGRRVASWHRRLVL